MKLTVLDTEGKNKKEIDTFIFDAPIREDIVQKVVETGKIKQPFSNFYLAGMQASASGKIRHARRKWKTAYGRGISRVPRKIFWRRGTQFYWEAATVSGTRGGRRAHPPKVVSMINTKKINKKEARKAFLSALALTSSAEHLRKKYNNAEINVSLPVVVDDKIVDMKTRELLNSIKKILGNLSRIAIQRKKIRSGKGKMRGRKYKKSAGALLVIGNEEERKISGIEVKRANELKTSDLFSNGARLTIYTEKSIIDLEERLGKKENGKGKEDEKAKKTRKKGRVNKKKETKKKINKENKDA